MEENNNSFYLVFEELEYSGIYEPSLELFKNKKDAELYIEKLKKENKLSRDPFYMIELDCK